MSTNMPRTLPELINWCNTHSTLWTANAAQIGLSPAQATAFATLCTNFVKANGTAQDARQASKNATKALTEAMNAVQATGGAYVNLIKAFAQTTHNPAVYQLAGVSADDPPSPVPAPVAPDRFGAAVNPDGSLTITWKVSQPAGVTSVQYLVFRRLPLNGETTFTMVSSEGKNKSYTDTTLPVGVDQVQYIVQPKRGEVTGPQSNVFSVQFGSVMGGGMSISTIASEAHDQPMKIAA